MLRGRQSGYSFEFRTYPLLLGGSLILQQNFNPIDANCGCPTRRGGYRPARMARPQTTTDADLSGDLSPDAALRRILAACRADLEKYRAVVLKSRRPVGIHQTRVALRRLRAAIALFKGAVDDPDFAALAAEARWIAGELAPSRDLHVFMKEIAPDAAAPVQRIGRRLANERHDRARQALSGPRYEDFSKLLGKVARAPASPTGTPLGRFGAGALAARHAKVQKRGHKLSELGATKLHKLRIAVKKLRYAAMFLHPIYSGAAFDSKATKAYIEATARLQGVLGSLNDRAMAADIGAAIAQAARPSEKVAKPLAHLAKEVKRGAKRDHRKLARAWQAFREAEPFWA
jgi:CHAD domain-containing protein